MKREITCQQHLLQDSKLRAFRTHAFHMRVQHLIACIQLRHGRISHELLPRVEEILATTADLGRGGGGSVFVFKLASRGLRLIHRILPRPVFHPQVLYLALYLRVLHCSP